MKHVAAYVVDEMVPVSAIDCPPFKHVLGKIPVTFKGSNK